MAKVEPPVVVGKAYDFALWMLPKVEKFPRSYKFSVGDRLADGALDILSLLVEAGYTREKRATLEQVNRNVNVVRYLLRLAKDLRLLSQDAYAFASERLEEIGRMTGGWLKSAGAPA